MKEPMIYFIVQEMMVGKFSEEIELMLSTNSSYFTRILGTMAISPPPLLYKLELFKSNLNCQRDHVNRK